MYYNIQQREAGRDQQITPVGIADVAALIIAGVHLRFSYPFPPPPPPPPPSKSGMYGTTIA